MGIKNLFKKYLPKKVVYPKKVVFQKVVVYLKEIEQDKDYLGKN